MGSLFSKALDFALTKAGKDSNFKLKTEQKSIIEAVFYLFTPFTRAGTFLKNFRHIFVGMTSSQSEVTPICPICFSFSARFSELSEIIDRIVASLEVRSAATANYFSSGRRVVAGRGSRACF